MKKSVTISSIIALVFCVLLGIWFFKNKFWYGKASIKVGILHSLTGTMASSEKSVVDATLLAIEEINKKGGILGARIEPIIADGKSDWHTFAQQAEKLITQDKVAVIFGCWTSASRKSVKPIVEKYKHLLFYPVQYEGLEESPNIVYTGAAPNQQILPAVTWAFENLGKSFYLVGSDYVFPRTANAIIKDHVAALGGTVVGEDYVPLGSKDVVLVIKNIVNKKPAVILNTINGDSNVPFFKELRQEGITPEKIPTISFSIAEPELQTLHVQDMIGDYAAWNYFESLLNKTNQQFVQAFKKKFGTDRVTSDPMEAAYFGVHCWAQAVVDAGSAQVETVLKTIKYQNYDAPEGVVSIESKTQHTWKFVRIGKVTQDGQFMIIWDSHRTIRPMPYPVYRDATYWDQFLQNLYVGWGNKWAKE